MNYHLAAGWAVLLGVAALWELTWKGLALWRAGRRGQTTWFVAVLIINSVGLLPIIYLILNKQRRSEKRNQARD